MWLGWVIPRAYRLGLVIATEAEGPVTRLTTSVCLSIYSVILVCDRLMHCGPRMVAIMERPGPSGVPGCCNRGKSKPCVPEKEVPSIRVGCVVYLRTKIEHVSLVIRPFDVAFSGIDRDWRSA